MHTIDHDTVFWLVFFAAAGLGAAAVAFFSLILPLLLRLFRAAKALWAGEA